MARTTCCWEQSQLAASGSYAGLRRGPFTQEDPIGLAGGMNLYGFAGGDPVSYSDPFGLCPEGVGADSARATGTRETTIWCEDGSSEVRRGGSRAWRNNNPGNLRYASLQAGTADGFAVFNTEGEGLEAMWRLLQSGAYQGLTLSELVNRYAPPLGKRHGSVHTGNNSLDRDGQKYPIVRADGNVHGCAHTRDAHARGTHRWNGDDRTAVTVNWLLRRVVATGFALAATLVASCSDRPDRSHVSMRESTETSRLSPPHGSDSSELERTVGCSRFGRSDVTFRGTVTRQVRLGPPGYGETPKRDRRDTIIVLHLDAPLVVCADSTINSASCEFRNLREVQLTGRIQGLESLVATKLTVRGVLLRAELPWHYTPVVLRIDNVLNRPTVRPPTTAAMIRGSIGQLLLTSGSG
jgi:hypothetical protein